MTALRKSVAAYQPGPKPFVRLLALKADEMTIGDIIVANLNDEYIPYFKLVRRPGEWLTHEEIICKCVEDDLVTSNECTRLVNVTKPRPTEIVFDDRAYSEGISESLKALRFSRSKHINDYRIGIKLTIGEAFLLAVKKDPSLLDVKVSFSFKISGSSLVQMRRINAGRIRVHAPSTLFDLVERDVESHRLYAVAKGNNRGSMFAS